MTRRPYTRGARSNTTDDARFQTPAEEIQDMFARAINWDVIDQLTDEQLDQLATEEDQS